MIEQPALPPLDEVLAAARVVQVPLRVPFRGVDERVAVLLRGPSGWGEFAPFFEYGSEESSWWLDAAVEAAFVGWPAPIRRHVPVNAIIPAVPPAKAEDLAATAAARGAGTIKVKVAEPGGSLAADADRIAAVRSTFSGHIRIDANGAWDVDAAVTALRQLDRVAGGLQYVEQPCATWDELARVRAMSDVPVAADESVRRADDPFEAVRRAAADIIVLKVPPLGGVRRCLSVAEATGLPVVVSSALDTGVGLAAGVALAAALPELPFDCGLGTGELLADDVVSPAVRPAHGSLPVTVAQPDPQALLRAEGRVSEGQRRAALERLRAAWRAGQRRREVGAPSNVEDPSVDCVADSAQ